MKVVLHGPLRDQFSGCEIGGSTVAEVIEGWSRQCGLSDLPMNLRPIIEVVGFETAESLQQETDVTEIHLAPMMFGGGGKFGQILIGAALIAVAIWNPAIGGMILSQAGITAVASVGIGLMVGGVLAMFNKAPSLSASNDPEPSKYISATGNSTQIGTLISKGYGRYKLGGQYLSVQVNSQDMVFGTFPASA